jgi:hypothetical protein
MSKAVIRNTTILIVETLAAGIFLSGGLAIIALGTLV